MKTFTFSLVLRTRENTDVFITLDENIFGIHSKRVNILYMFSWRNKTNTITSLLKNCFIWSYENHVHKTDISLPIVVLLTIPRQFFCFDFFIDVSLLAINITHEFAIYVFDIP